MDRRTLISGTLAAASVKGAPASYAANRSWEDIASDYEVTTDILNLENGNWGIMARPVLEAYQRNTARINRDNSYYTRQTFWRDFTPTMETIAAFLGVEAGELAITRNATEALQGLILQYEGLRAGDSILYADLDYGSIQRAMGSLAKRAGAKAVKLVVPEPATYDGLIRFYKDAIEQTPSAKLLLLTHISHRTGLKLPVKEIIAYAKSRGVDVILDAAHSWGQVELNLDDLGADFTGLNLHKWIGAPLGVGLMVIRRARLRAIAPHPLSAPREAGSMRGRVHTGTMNYAALLTLSDALAYHRAIGPARKAQRLAGLRRRWVAQVAIHPAIDVLTPLDDARLSAAITSVRLSNLNAEDLAAQLLKRHEIFTVKRSGIAAGDAVRITPALYNTMEDMDRCAAALLALAQ